MATLTTDTFLDDLTVTAGELMTLNGARLTVRTDTRWHAGSPASMTGSLGSIYPSSTLGGYYELNATTVRWLAFDTGTGNVPAIGTSVTQGGASASYLLGVWASITSAPTAVGAAMPTSGFLKFREVTGAFATGALTGIGANATGADVVGWIEVVHDQTSNCAVPRFGEFKTRGNWFSLGTTTGAANQIVQIPTNGSTTTYVPGVWIATTATPTTDEDWELYSALYAAGMTTTNLGTDARSKFVLMGTDGTIRIGHNGTTTVGYVPPSGREIRIANIFGRQCATGTRATNILPSAGLTNRPEITTTGAGYIDVENFACDWYFNCSEPYYIKIHHTAYFETIKIIECATAISLYNGGSGYSQAMTDIPLYLESNTAGGTVNKWNASKYSSGSGTALGHSIEVLYCKDITFTNCKSGITAFSRNTNGEPYKITQSENINFNNCYSFNGQVSFEGSMNCTITNHDHCDRYVGATNSTTPKSIVNITGSSSNIVVNGGTVGLQGTIANVYPYSSLVLTGPSTNCVIKNMGSIGSRITMGTAGYAIKSSGNNKNLKIQRIYTQSALGIFLTNNSDRGVLCEHVYGDNTDTFLPESANTTVRNIRATTPSLIISNSTFGTHFWDTFTADTTGRLVLSMNEPTAETTDYVTVVAGTVKFDALGRLVMTTTSSQVIFEQHYFTLGCTALPNIGATIDTEGLGSYTFEYQIDTNNGSGWNGTWKTLNGANLSAETITPDAGFKVKYRITCTSGFATNWIRSIYINTTSTLTAQTDNLYPLATVTVKVTAKDATTLTAIENAMVYIEAASGGPLTAGTVIMKQLTNASGISQDVGFAYSADQPVIGRVRKSTSSPLYQTAPISGTITSTGFDITSFLIKDE